MSVQGKVGHHAILTCPMAWLKDGGIVFHDFLRELSNSDPLTQSPQPTLKSRGVAFCTCLPSARERKTCPTAAQFIPAPRAAQFWADSFREQNMKFHKHSSCGSFESAQPTNSKRIARPNTYELALEKAPCSDWVTSHMLDWEAGTGNGRLGL